MFLYSPISSRFILADRWFGTNPKLLEHIDSLGSIECMFKNQKSNGFYLEATMTRNIHAFENLYSITCFAVLFLTIYGTYYEKNKYKVFRNFKLKTSYQKFDKSRARYIVDIRLTSLLHLLKIIKSGGI